MLMARHHKIAKLFDEDFFWGGGAMTKSGKKLIGDESKLLEDHRKENKEILTRHFYDMSNMMSGNEGVWLSNGWVKTLLWLFLPCFLYTVISIVYFVASYLDK